MSKKLGVVLDIKEAVRPAYHLYRNYLEFFEEGGFLPFAVHYTDRFPELLVDADGIVLVGGGIYFKDEEPYRGKPLEETNPYRYAFEKQIIAYALENSIPLIGICRGAQTIAQEMGGTITNVTGEAFKRLHGEGKHPVELREGSEIREALGKREAVVNTYHVKEIATVPDDFVVTARAPDGVIEAYEARPTAGQPPMIGMQFHPERLPDPEVRACILQALTRIVEMTTPL